MKNRGSIISGSLLILMGVCFFIAQLFPGLADIINFSFLWPLIPLAVGVSLFVAGLIWEPPLLIPGTIVSGVGSILFYQNATGNWHHWQLWLLVPSLVGVGILLSMIRSGEGATQGVKAGGVPFVVGIILFAVFTMGTWFNYVWPLLLIAAGVFWLVKGMHGSETNAKWK